MLALLVTPALSGGLRMLEGQVQKIKQKRTPDVCGGKPAHGKAMIHRGRVGTSSHFATGRAP